MKRAETQKVSRADSIMTHGDASAYFFHQGTNFRAYEYLGCHFEKDGDGYKYTFRVWAPNAEEVCVVGDFNAWKPVCPMEKLTDMGVWEYTLITTESIDGSNYKYRITGKNGTHLKADPYARSNETLWRTASRVYEPKEFAFTDELWFKYRKKAARGSDKNKHEFFSAPLNIYEVHLASWMTRDGRSTKESFAYLNYREIADRLAPYVKQMGYTHVELLPIMEYPYDGSLGYQVCGYYSPTSRFGSPEDFKYFVNKLHEMGIGVILEWVPAHFPKDEHGLYEFDGEPLYEYGDAHRMENKAADTHFFDVERGEVRSFLISNAMYWMREFHIDGLKIGSMEAMFEADPEAVSFFRKLNTAVFGEYPDALMIAEISGDYPAVTTPVYDGGLGFNFKWNTGFTHEVLEYASSDTVERQFKHDKLTSPIGYSLNENHILPISHNNVAHGKKSLLDKQFGEYNQKFAGFRATLAYQMTHPGKKLTFMGSELAPFKEWDYENQLEWFMTDFEMHKKSQMYVSALNQFYLANKELWEQDFSWDGFEWIYPSMNDLNVIAFRRLDKKGNELVIVINFSPVDINGFTLVNMRHSRYTEVFSSDAYEFGGNGKLNHGTLDTHLAFDSTNELRITLPAMTALILKPIAPIKKSSKK